MIGVEDDTTTTSTTTGMMLGGRLTVGEGREIGFGPGEAPSTIGLDHAR